MARKTIEYKGEFKVNMGFTMTSGEGVSNEAIKKAVKLMHNNVAKEIEEAVNYWFNENEEGVDNFKVTCKKIDTTTNVIDNTSEPEKVSEELKTETTDEYKTENGVIIK